MTISQTIVNENTDTIEKTNPNYSYLFIIY